jgi:peptidoglycan hydrolase-like protein with peptidoglycan-binding domain
MSRPLDDGALGDALAKKGLQQSLNVAALQGALTTTGHYMGPIDGKWTPELEQALKDYQKSQQLPATGVVDAVTLAALLGVGQSAPSSAPSTSSTKPATASSTTSSVSAAPTTTVGSTSTTRA